MATQIASSGVNGSSVRTLWRTSASVLYAFYSDQGTFNSSSPGVSHMMKSTNNGSTWAEVDAAHRPTLPDYESQSYSGDIGSNGKIHIVYQTSATNPTNNASFWSYVTFDTTTDLWATTEYLYTPTGTAGGYVAMLGQSIAVDRANIPHVILIYSNFDPLGGISTVYSRYINRVGGSWGAGVPLSNPSSNSNTCDIIIDNNNRAIIVQDEDDGAGNYGTIVVYNAPSNNPVSFTRNVVATTVTFTNVQVNIVLDDLYNAWIAINHRDYTVRLYKHNNGDSWATWQSPITNGAYARNIQMTTAGRNVYLVYDKTASDGSTALGLGLDSYNGTYWAGETILETAASGYRDAAVRYSSNNQYAPGTVDMVVTKSPGVYFDTFAGTTAYISYFDASDVAATDPGGLWTSDGEAFNADLTTGASTTSYSTQSSGYLMAEGTNTAVLSGPISSVQVRVLASAGTPSWSGYTTLSTPTGGWTWQKLNDLEVKIDGDPGIVDNQGKYIVHANVYTNGLAENLGAATINLGPSSGALSVIRVELLTTYIPFVSYTPSHGTSAVKKIIPTSTHLTDGNKRKTTTRVHTTSAIKRIAGLIKTHFTSASKRVSGLAKTHTTSSNKKKQTTVSFTTDTLKYVPIIKTHSTDANKRKSGLTRAHTADAFLRMLQGRSHSTDANKELSTVQSHTTDINKRKASTVSHTTSGNKRISGATRSHTTDALKRKQSTKTQTTDALKRKSGLTRIHTTSTLKRSARSVVHTSSANKRAGGVTLSHLTDANARKSIILSHTTDAFLQPSFGILSTDYFDVTFVPVAVTYTVAHTTDTNKRKTNTVSQTTDTNTRKSNTLTQTTDANKNKSLTKSHTTDGNRRKSAIVSHTTDAFKRVQSTISHETDANKRKLLDVFHSTDTYLRGALERLHSTDANKRKALSVDHSTDANKLKVFVVDHITDAFLRIAVAKSHTTDALKRTPLSATHSTDANTRKPNSLVHTTDALLRRILSAAHSTDAFKRKANVVTHATDANKNLPAVLSHTTDALKRISGIVITHTTDAYKRISVSILHATDAIIRHQTTASHSTDANMSTTLGVAHNTDGNKLKSHELLQTTDANKRNSAVVGHATDTNKRKANIILSHTTDAVMRGASQATHSTDTLVSTSHSTRHNTSASKWSRRGTKKVLVNGVWHYGVVKVLIDGEWTIVSVRYFNGTDWPLTEQ